MMGGVTQETLIVVAVTAPAVTFSGGLLGAIIGKWKRQKSTHIE